jgi:hypothetical protein
VIGCCRGGFKVLFSILPWLRDGDLAREGV